MTFDPQAFYGNLRVLRSHHGAVRLYHDPTNVEYIHTISGQVFKYIKGAAKFANEEETDVIRLFIFGLSTIDDRN